MIVAHKVASLVMALAFSGAIILLIDRCFGSPAARAQIGRGAGLSLASLILAVIFSMVAMVGGASLTGAARTWHQAFVVAAAGEECARWICLLILMRGLMTHEIGEFVAGAAAVGLGFGVIENLLYLTGAKDVLIVGALRGVLSAPAHFGFAMVSAWGLWRWLRMGEPAVVALAALAVAILLHGAYDAGLMFWPSPDEWASHAMGAPLRAGIGLAIVGSILAITVATLLALSDFLQLSESRPSRRWDEAWMAFGAILLPLGALIALSAFGVVAVMSWPGLAFAPMLIGAGGSLALWGTAIRQIAR
jgi:RsiW-degrading membrane proteinase PrsW (M82 family)